MWKRLFLLCVLAGSPVTAEHSKPQQWRITEPELKSSLEHSNPIVDVQVTAVFNGPDGTILEIPGFWDGGSVWKIRFTPPAPGKWSYETVCDHEEDAGLHGHRGSLSVAPAESDNPIYKHGGFLRVSATKRYLTYSDGTPFFWIGDTWWFAPSYLVPYDTSAMPNDPTGSMYRTLIDTRRRQGYSVVQMAFWGGFEFFTEAFFYQPQYWGIDQIKVWRKIDDYFRYANDAGIVPAIGTFWGSYWDFYGLKLENLKLQWRYIVSRYGAFGTTWLVCGEYNAPQPAGARTERIADILTLGQFIKDVDPYKRAMSIHPHPGDWNTKGGRRQAWDKPWHDFIMMQGGHSGSKDVPPADLYWQAYEGKIKKPILQSECKYEGIHGMGEEMVRHAAYRAIQAGSFGYTYGAQGLWFPISSTDRVPERVSPAWGDPVLWWEALAKPGGAQMQHLRACYESVKWWRLEPRPDAVRTKAALPEKNRILVKADGDRTFLLYFPGGLDPALKATLRGGNQSLSYEAAWFCPRNGDVKTVARNITMPDGELSLPERPDSKDWVLILKATN